MHPKSIINSPLWKYSSITIRKKICNDTLWRFIDVKYKYGFFVLIFATTAMFSLQDKKVQVLCESCSVVSDSLSPTEFSRPEYWSGQLFPSPGDLPNPGIEPRSPALQVDSLPAEPGGKPTKTGVGSLSLLQRIFLTQELNWGLLHCRWILYQLSYQGALNALKETILRKKFPLKKAHINLL